MSNATIRRDCALEELRKVADRLDSAEADGLRKANEEATRSDLAGYVRDVFVREYAQAYVRAEAKLSADMVRFAVSRLEPRRPGKR